MNLKAYKARITRETSGIYGVGFAGTVVVIIANEKTDIDKKWEIGNVEDATEKDLSEYGISINNDQLALATEQRDGLLKAAKKVMFNLKEPCRLDHHGYCQTHFIENPCSVAELNDAIRKAGDK